MGREGCQEWGGGVNGLGGRVCGLGFELKGGEVGRVRVRSGE